MRFVPTPTFQLQKKSHKNHTNTRYRPRPPLLACGALMWGINTMLLSCTSSLWAWFLLRALNGIALACLNPLCQSFVADYTVSKDRGWFFGIFQLFHQGGVLVMLLTEYFSKYFFSRCRNVEMCVFIVCADGECACVDNSRLECVC